MCNRSNPSQPDGDAELATSFEPVQKETEPQFDQ